MNTKLNFSRLIFCEVYQYAAADLTENQRLLKEKDFVERNKDDLIRNFREPMDTTYPSLLRALCGC